MPAGAVVTHAASIEYVFDRCKSLRGVRDQAGAVAWGDAGGCAGRVVRRLPNRASGRRQFERGLRQPDTTRRCRDGNQLASSAPRGTASMTR